MRKVLTVLFFFLLLLPVLTDGAYSSLSAQGLPDQEIGEVVVIGEWRGDCPRCKKVMTANEYAGHKCCVLCHKDISETMYCDCTDSDLSGSGSGGGGSGRGSGGTSKDSNTNSNRKITGLQVPDKVRRFLLSLKQGGGVITVTSVQRSVESQAKAMLKNIKRTGVEVQKKIYGPNGDRICDAFNKKLSDLENIQKFMSIMNSYTDPSVFSHHLGGYDWRCTFDISQSALQNSSDLFYEIKSRMSKNNPNYDPNILRVYYENGCIHIEYKIKD